ncbi:hypothetical protein Ancab_017729 [Ancistrocladus abbreviatus]
MLSFSSLQKKSQHLWRSSICSLVSTLFNFILFQLNPFIIQLFYFIFFSFFGFLILKALKPRTPNPPKDLDLFFTSVSATTVSSMSTVEMEVFSNAQLIVMTILMFIGGEVFTSTVGLQFNTLKLNKSWKGTSGVNSFIGSLPTNNNNSTTFEMTFTATLPDELTNTQHEIELQGKYYLKYSSIKFLGYLVLAYLLITHFIGIAMVLTYINLVKSARDVLEDKGLKTMTFAMFTIVSSFASCGFVPTNENMVAFKKNSGLLIIILPQLHLGNTLFPSCLRLLIWVLGRVVKRKQCDYLLKRTREVGFHHLLPSMHSRLLAVTVFGFIVVQMILFCVMEWNSQGLSGLNGYQKFVGVLFQCANSRHTGEGIVDLSTITPSILTMFVVMMYLPPYTSFLPVKDDDEEEEEEIQHALHANGNKRKRIVENVVFSQLSYLVIFIILICITERDKMREDPLNFSVLNIVFEVISAYGNVGFSLGYSCERRLNTTASCIDKSYGFSGKWSNQGKIMLIVVMFFGRHKKFNMNGGKAWKLL